VKNDEKKELIIYGKQPVFEALRSEHPMSKIYLAKEMEKKDTYKISSLAKSKANEVIYTKKADLQKICGPVLHQGVVAVLDEYQYLSEEQLLHKISLFNEPFVLILDQIQDPHNLGAIIRTAESAGITAIILPEKGSADVTPTVVKTSAGAVFHCPIHRAANLPAILEKLKEKEISLSAMVPHQNKTIYDSDLKGPLALVVGSEGKGVRKNIQRLCDKSISIPAYGKVDSLNASVSTGIVLFEAVRQRLKKG
jgi:23S rRNA (guanosine2251-2'-O)-methyltransferase